MTSTSNTTWRARTDLRVITDEAELVAMDELANRPTTKEDEVEEVGATPPTQQVAIPETAPPLAPTDSTINPSFCHRLVLFAWNVFQAYDFPILLLAFIGIAKAAPEFGAVHVAPQYTATWIAVSLIFFLSGLGLRCEQIVDALKNYRFHLFVQVFNFGFASAVVFEVSRILKSTGALSHALSDGLAICGCLPMAINAVTVLTVGCHGDEASSIFNEIFGNLVGVFLSPVLIRGYLGPNDSNASLTTILWKLVVRVMAPLIVGQALRVSSTQVAEFRQAYAPWLVRAQKYLLIFIVYTIFCLTFASKVGGITLQDTLVLILVIFLLQIFLLACAALSGWLLFIQRPKLRVVALFGGTAKTIALGIPLIQSLYENNEQVGSYTLAILIWHPLLLVVGSCMTPMVANVVDRELARLGRMNIDSTVGEEKIVPGEETGLALVEPYQEKEMTLAEYNSATNESIAVAIHKQG